MNKKQIIFIWYINKIIILILIKRKNSTSLMYIRPLSASPQFISEVHLELKHLKGEVSVIRIRSTHSSTDLYNSRD